MCRYVRNTATSLPQIHFLQEIPEEETQQGHARNPYRGHSRVEELLVQAQDRVNKVLLCTVPSAPQPRSPIDQRSSHVPTISTPHLTNRRSLLSEPLSPGTRPFSLIEAPSRPFAQNQSQLQHARSLSSVSAYQSQFGNRVSEFGSTTPTPTGLIDGSTNNVRFATFPVEGRSSYTGAGATSGSYHTDGRDHEAQTSSQLSAQEHGQLNSFSSLVPQTIPASSQDQQQLPAGPLPHESEEPRGDEPAPPYSELSAGSDNSWTNTSGRGTRSTPASPTIVSTQGQGLRNGTSLTYSLPGELSQSSLTRGITILIPGSTPQPEVLHIRR